MKKISILFGVILISNLAEAQLIKEKSLNLQIGRGFSSIDLINVDDGLYVQGELALKVISWVELRPYIGLIFGNSRTLLTGGKVRVRPFRSPWLATFVEIGIGASIGKFRTLATFDNIEKEGIIYDIPFSFGVELGRDNNVSIGHAFYSQPSVEQFTGAFLVGIKFPLN